jgi:hypothetical protein
MKRQPFFWCWVALSVSAGLRAQNPDHPMGAEQTRSASGAVVSRPVRKTDSVTTNDSISLLVGRRAPRTVPQSTEAGSAGAGDEAAAGDLAARKAREIAILEKQVREKQERIALLMKLFVDDEKEFLKRGGAAEADPVVRERRRYEQDELRWEAAEAAKLQVQLEQLKRGDAK